MIEKHGNGELTQMARPTDPQASINAYLQKTRERFVRPFRQPLRSGNLSTVASISLKQDPWAPVRPVLSCMRSMRGKDAEIATSVLLDVSRALDRSKSARVANLPHLIPVCGPRCLFPCRIHMLKTFRDACGIRDPL